jgi:hypothetical protein
MAHGLAANKTANAYQLPGTAFPGIDQGLGLFWVLLGLPQFNLGDKRQN